MTNPFPLGGDFDEETEFQITATRSAGSDGAVVIFIDGNFQPHEGLGVPGLRIVVNDVEAVFAHPEYLPNPDPDDLQTARVARFNVRLASIDYDEEKR